MTLPKAKKKKLMGKEEFVKLANKVKKSFEEEATYLRDKAIKNGRNKLSCDTYSFS